MILDGDFIRLNTFANDEERKTAISLHLLAGGPLSVADQYNTVGDSLRFYQNREMLALNEDGFVGKPLTNVPTDERSQIWTGQMADGRWVAGLFNRENTPRDRAINFAAEFGFVGQGAVRDLWAGTGLGAMSSYEATVPPHGCVVLSVTDLSIPPAFTTHPSPQTARLGGSVTLTAEASDADSVQWEKDGAALAGATGTTLTLTNFTEADAGTYALVATNAFGTTISQGAVVVADIPSNTRLVNISTRAEVGTGDDVMIAGFVLTGVAQKSVLLRASGPALSQFGITNMLPDPVLELRGTAGLIRENDDWDASPGDKAMIEAAAAEAGAFAWPVGMKDAAIIAQLAPTSYTAVMGGKTDATGVGLVEIHAMDPGQGPRLVNLSTRSLVRNGEAVQIAGIVLAGTGPRTVLLRASGPALAALNVAGTLSDPRIEVRDAHYVMASNDDWSPGLAQVFDETGAFAWQTGSKDAAVVLTLNPGSYTAIVSGHGEDEGVALVEVYEVDAPSSLP